MGEGWGEGVLLKGLIPFAKKLRKNSTDTENYLWKYLRARRLAGHKFKRQESIGSYIVDFVCFEKRVIIECDGGQHLEQSDKDEKRDRWFEEQGYKVLRFWDHEVWQNTDAVLEIILKESEGPPSHQGKGDDGSRFSRAFM